MYEPQTGDQNPCTVHSKTTTLKDRDTGSLNACVVRRATLSVFITSGSDSKQHAMKVGVRLSYSSSFMCMRVPEWKDHMTLKKKERSLLTPALHKDPAFLMREAVSRSSRLWDSESNHDDEERRLPCLIRDHKPTVVEVKEASLCS